MGVESIEHVGWAEAWERARKLLDGVARRRLVGASPEIELGLLDWGGAGELVVLHHAMASVRRPWRRWPTRFESAFA